MKKPTTLPILLSVLALFAIGLGATLLAASPAPTADHHHARDHLNPDTMPSLPEPTIATPAFEEFFPDTWFDPDVPTAIYAGHDLSTLTELPAQEIARLWQPYQDIVDLVQQMPVWGFIDFFLYSGDGSDEISLMMRMATEFTPRELYAELMWGMMDAVEVTRGMATSPEAWAFVQDREMFMFFTEQERRHDEMVRNGLVSPYAVKAYPTVYEIVTWLNYGGDADLFVDAEHIALIEQIREDLRLDFAQ